MIRFAHRRVSLVVDGSKTRASSSSIISSLCQREQYCVWYLHQVPDRGEALDLVSGNTPYVQCLATVPEAHRPLPTRENWYGGLCGVNSALYVLKKSHVEVVVSDETHRRR
jgi:hypothetical protein